MELVGPVALHNPILPRQGEVAAKLTEGEVVLPSKVLPSAPSEAFGPTSPWRGRIAG